jgi:hypothetical protein
MHCWQRLSLVTPLLLVFFAYSFFAARRVLYLSQMASLRLPGYSLRSVPFCCRRSLMHGLVVAFCSAMSITMASRCAVAVKHNLFDSLILPSCAVEHKSRTNGLQDLIVSAPMVTPHYINAEGISLRAALGRTDEVRELASIICGTSHCRPWFISPILFRLEACLYLREAQISCRY